MKRIKVLFWSLFTIAVLLIGSACGLIGKIVNTAEKGKTAAETIQAIATSADDVIGQIENMATEVGGSGMLQTAQAMATEVGESGILQTAQAMATEMEDSGMLSTLQAAVTQVPTDMGDLQATVQAGMESIQQSPPPEDVPVVPGETESQITSADLISYLTPMAYKDVVDFYTKEMPANGWEQTDEGVVMETSAMLFFTKDDRNVMVAIVADAQDGMTQVTITITQH